MKSIKPDQNSSHCSCNERRTIKPGQRFTVILGFLIAILPKCHFCVIAYTGAITLCSGAQLGHYTPTLGVKLMPLLGLIVLISIALNWRDQRTVVALSLGIIALTLLMTSAFMTGNQQLYQLGAYLMFFGAWVNGSFLYFFRKMWNAWKLVGEKH